MAGRQAVLGIEGGAFFHASTKVFSGVTFLLDDARTALVGENGVGKSTLLKCLTGELELNAGKIIRSRNLRIGALPQEVPPGLAPLTVRAVLERSLARVGAAGEAWRIDVLLAEIGAPADLAEQRFGELSGGWQRLMLIAAAARLEEPDILILDEPTNHLDLANIATLEAWLTAETRLPMLIVSHDRAFLERVTTRTLFLRADGTHAFKAPFARAREELLRRDAAAGVRRRIEEREIKRLEKVAARYHAWGMKNDAFHKRQKATENRIARIQASKTAVYQARERRLELAEGEIDAKVSVRIENLAVKTPPNPAGGGADPLRHRSAWPWRPATASPCWVRTGPASPACWAPWPPPSASGARTTTAPSRCASNRRRAWHGSTRPWPTFRWPTALWAG